ncbi:MULTISPECIES: hypothetical protein [Serratia]|uniref:hypothetical protein n=1 Tax=Serratia TaxID=613 RepID=UPI0007609164|nr:hypothetical protein [Serratia marcescens]HBC5209728.1 hypothetical protein [Serratia marcescens]
MKMGTGNNSWWSYVWGVITALLSAMTLQDFAFAGGVVVTATFTYLTYRSNDRRNKAAIAAEQERTRLYAEWIDSQKGKSADIQAAAVDVIGHKVEKAEAEA